MEIAILGHFTSFTALARIAVIAVLLYGLHAGLRRTVLPPSVQRRTFFVAAFLILGWTSIVWYLGAVGAFQARPDVRVPLIPFAVIVPIIVGWLLVTRSGAMRAAVEAIPHSWLIGFQVYRVLGFTFLWQWWSGLLPGQFALPAGIGDVLVGILALVVAFSFRGDTVRARRLAYGWNVLGIIDLVIALTMGFLTSPGRFQILAFDNPNLLTTAFPLVLIPASAVPQSILLHMVSLWKLQQPYDEINPSAGLSNRREKV